MDSSRNNKTTVLIVENNLVIGGTQRLVLDQVSALDPKLYDVHLATMVQYNATTLYDRLPEYVNIWRLDKKKIYDIKTWFALARVIRLVRPDVIKSTSYFCNTLTRGLSFFFPFVHIGAEHNTRLVKNFLQRRINRILAKRSFTTVTDSVQVAEALSSSEHTPIDRYTVINNGVHLKEISDWLTANKFNREKIRNSLGFSSSDIVFVSVARLVPQKNHILMIDAFGIVCKEYPDAKLLVVGDGSQKKQLQQAIVRNHIEDKVCLAGEVKDIYPCYLSADYTISSSAHEGFSIAAIENMYFGAPLISTAVAGPVEYIIDGKNGYLAKNNPKDYAKTVMLALMQSEQKYTEQAQEAIKTAQHYSVEKYQYKFKKLIDEAVVSR